MDFGDLVPAAPPAPAPAAEVPTAEDAPRGTVLCDAPAIRIVWDDAARVGSLVFRGAPKGPTARSYFDSLAWMLTHHAALQLVFDLTEVPTSEVLSFVGFAKEHIAFNAAHRGAMEAHCRGVVVVLPNERLRPLLNQVFRATPPTQPVTFVRFPREIPATLEAHWAAPTRGRG